ncbi:MAG: DedA family protein [Haloarculaceae archaeon]
MFQGLVDAMLGFVAQYGYVAVFVYMALETAFILHYVPSEVVVPFAAIELVHDPLSFALFVVDATVGATVGSLLAYVLFGRYGRELLERYGHVIHVSQDRLEWSEDVFARHGKSSVFWGRLLPFLRAFISIPAGLAEMDLRTFTLYSATGAFLFNTVLTYLAYSGSGTASPFELLLEELQVLAADAAGFGRAHAVLVAAIVGGVALAAVAVWRRRESIRSNPAPVRQGGLEVVRVTALLVGGVVVIAALSSPDQTFTAVTALWTDASAVQAGFAGQVTLLIVGALVALAGVMVYEVGTLAERTRLRAAIEHLRSGR